MGELRNPLKHILKEKGNDSYVFHCIYTEKNVVLKQQKFS